MDPCKRPCPYKPKIHRQRLKDGRVDVTYPKVIGVPAPSQNCMNTRIKEQVNLMIRNQGYPEEPVTFTGNYRVRLNDKCWLSLTEEIYSYRDHAAHGITIMKPWNFDILTGVDMELSDLFIPFSGYVQEINRHIEKQIAEREIPLLRDFVSISENPNYYLTPTHLVIFFPIYDYTPYVYGIPEFPIPLADLKPYVSSASPLARLYCP